MSNPVEGWYPDPAGTAQLRWWDGYSWTDDYLPDDTVQDYGADSYSEADQAYTYDAGYRDATPTDDAGYQDAAPTYDAGYRDAAPTDDAGYHRRLGSPGAAQGPGQAARNHRHPVAAHRGLHRRRDRDNQPVPLRQQGVQAG